MADNNGEQLNPSEAVEDMIRRATAPRTIEVRKTDAQEYIRCHADPEWRMDCVVLHIKRRETTYLVRPELYASLRHEVKFQVGCGWAHGKQSLPHFFGESKMPKAFQGSDELRQERHQPF